MPINDPRVRAFVIQSLCSQLSREPDASVRCAIVNALAQIGAEESLSMLAQLLQDEDNDVRQAAAGAIGAIGRSVSENSVTPISTQMSFFAPVYGAAGIVQESQTIRIDLTAVNVQVQRILNEIAQTNTTDSTAIAQIVKERVEQNPDLKARLLGALKAGGIEAVKAIFNHPVVSIPIEMIIGFLEPES